MDVFGNGRTAIKASIGRFNQLTRSDLTRRFHPFSSSINSANRTWNDFTYPAGDPRNGNYIPDCELANFSTNGECGPIWNGRDGRRSRVHRGRRGPRMAANGSRRLSGADAAAP